MKATIRSKRFLTDTIVELRLYPPDGYPTPTPGQFVRIDCHQLLPRPFSVGIGSIPEALCLIVEAVGPGTKWLASQPEGGDLDISLPLGNGFALDKKKDYLLVGGGIGVAPLASVHPYRVGSLDALLCFRTADRVILEEDFLYVAKNPVIVATDDGSYGIPGRADTVLRDHLARVERDAYDAILACGPRPMLEAVVAVAHEFGIPCQVSLEERMACAVGVCLGCAVETKYGMLTVCADGPVFDSEEVIW